MVSWFIVHCFRVSELCIEGSGSGVVVESCFVVFHLDVMCVHYFDCSCCLFVELVSCVDFVLLVVVSILWLSLVLVSWVYSTTGALFDCLWTVSWSWRELQAALDCFLGALRTWFFGDRHLHNTVYHFSLAL